MTPELHPEALAVLRVATSYYEQEAELGAEFVEAVNVVIARCLRKPDAYPRWPGLSEFPRIRRAAVKRFPNALAFEVVGAQLHVLAIVHRRRRPLYWLSRAAEAGR